MELPLGWRLRDACKEGEGVSAGITTAASSADRDIFGRSVGAATLTGGLGWEMSASAVEVVTFGVIDMALENSKSQ